MGVGAAAFLVRFVVLTRGGGLLGSAGYDDGVYYAAADALVNGRLPYRDFLFIQPPGIVLAVAPFACVGALAGDPLGFAAARLGFIGIGAGNAVLVTVILRQYGIAAAALGGGLYAVFLPAAYAERSALLEPAGTLAVLAGLLLLQRARDVGSGRRAVLLAGAAFGLAATVKIWFIVPLLIAAAFTGRHRWRYLAGAGTALVVVYGPFLAADPAATIRQVVLDQLGRPRAAASLTTRLGPIIGAPQGGVPAPFHWVTSRRVRLLLLLAVIALAVVTLLVRDARIYPAMLLADIVVLLASPSWFPHYAALTAPLIALTTGIGLTRLLRRLPPPGRAAAVGAVLVVVVAGNWPGISHATTTPIPAAVLARAAAPLSGCVVGDDPATLAAIDVLSRDYARGCNVWPDVTGWTYDRDQARAGGKPVARIRNVKWQRHLLTYLTHADAFLQVRADSRPSRSTKAALTARPLLARVGAYTLRAGTTHPRQGPHP